MAEEPDTDWLETIRWGDDGLIAAVAQDAESGDVLTLAWMNREALLKTLQSGYAVYWSRSRQCLWKKGERSGHTQKVQDVFLDCDKDSVLLRVNQTGGIACHTGRRSCFFLQFKNNRWEESSPVLKSPEEIYKTDH